ncbi:hypothetical protein BDW69DRAFT_164963 [Aspergillus filifer]
MTYRTAPAAQPRAPANLHFPVPSPSLHKPSCQTKSKTRSVTLQPTVLRPTT